VRCTGNIIFASIIDFLSDLFCRFGTIEELVSDNGLQFISGELQQFLSAHGVRHSKTASYNPQANCEVERFHRVKEGLKAALVDHKFFQQGVRKTLASYQSTLQRTTGEVRYDEADVQFRNAHLVVVTVKWYCSEITDDST